MKRLLYSLLFITSSLFSASFTGTPYTSCHDFTANLVLKSAVYRGTPENASAKLSNSCKTLPYNASLVGVNLNSDPKKDLHEITLCKVHNNDSERVSFSFSYLQKILP